MLTRGVRHHKCLLHQSRAASECFLLVHAFSMGWETAAEGEGDEARGSTTFAYTRPPPTPTRKQTATTTKRTFVHILISLSSLALFLQFLFMKKDVCNIYSQDDTTECLCLSSVKQTEFVFIFSVFNPLHRNMICVFIYRMSEDIHNIIDTHTYISIYMFDHLPAK